MLRGLYTSYTGMLNEQYRMDIMSNSLANVNTVGFKKEGSTSQAYADVMAVKIKDWTETPNTPKKLGEHESRRENRRDVHGFFTGVVQDDREYV